MDVPPGSAKMSSETFSQFVMSIDDLYNMAVRNGFYLPKQSCSAVNELMISNVLKGDYWCPKTAVFYVVFITFFIIINNLLIEKALQLLLRSLCARNPYDVRPFIDLCCFLLC